ncbi:alpha/beta hydrolase [Mycobacterium sp. OTB74]|jgi:pimeloyl-ACP methyl ester carboxylesterase|uniref:alpha/beta fold hydrolase n=1 Tax=Mycobacterium sp. OTB74 TaxID=1853452 RepID=UPI0024765890|nr:alpha/beta hydrolase [Mycobacterium sp. OTB74]MDH6245852.1 pimeloyl-ACP methyl ester carboxylesterase [Mycobacterium sp. OTB74]
MTALPELDGVTHRFVDLGNGITIHVAEAGPADGRPVMLVHGFPQHWWEWREVIGPLAAGGYRVFCPDLRGAGWSSAPADAYRKNDMADDLATLLDRLNSGPVTLVAHDWGGFVAFIMMLRHPAKVAGFLGLNTGAPWVSMDGPLIRHLWRFWYQIPLALPIVGPRIIADPKARYLRLVVKWVGAGYLLPEHDFQLYAGILQDQSHAVAGSRWYRTFLRREFYRWLRGEFADEHVKVPVRWLHGSADPVITPVLLRRLVGRVDDFKLNFAPGVGHWIAEQEPELVLAELSSLLSERA